MFFSAKQNVYISNSLFFTDPILHGSRPYGRLSHSTLASHHLEIFETSSIMASQPTPTNVPQK